MRTLVAVSVRRRVTVLMFALAVAAFGIVGYGRLSLDLLPDISYPSLTIQTQFPDTAPNEVENLVTRPIEEAVGVLRGLQSIHSVSRSGVSEVTLEFDWDADMDMLSMDVREKLDRLVLPDEAEDPIVLRFDPSLDPILRIALTGPGDLAETRRIADRKLKQEFETLKGVASAQVKGGLEEEIQVNVDQDRLAALGISLDQVRNVVGVSNINLPGGLIENEENQLLIRMVNEYQSVDEIANLIVRQGSTGTSSTQGGLNGQESLTGQEGGLVRLRDVADVRWGTKERDEITRLNGQECVEIAIYKEGDANTVQAARRVRQEMAALQSELPPGHTMKVLFDQSRFIERAINEVRGAALIGGILAILVLFAFLRDVRSTLIIATSIPLSVVATFMVMYRMGISLNIMSLGGLTLAIGMLVDNSIVVLESIFRRRKQGLSLARAAVEGTSEVGNAVIASTLTTVAVFVPIIFVEGIAGQLFKDMALTVTFGLLASLLIAVTLIPMLSAVGSERERARESGRRREGVPAQREDARGRPEDATARREEAARQEEDTGGAGGTGAISAPGGFPGAPRSAASPGEGGDSVMTLGFFSAIYDRLVRTAIRRRWATLGIALLLFVAAFLGVRRLDTELIPPIDEGEFYFEVNMPEGTPLAATDRVIGKMEDAAAKSPEIDLYYSRVGSRLSTGGLALNTKAENLGQINFVMRNRSDEAAQAAVTERLRKDFETIPDLEVKSGKPTYFSLRTPIELNLFGEDLEALRTYSLEIQRALGQVKGLVDIRSSLEAGNPELRIIFDRARLAALGLDMRQISETLRDRVSGAVPTRFKEEDRQIDIRVRNQVGDRATIQDIRNLVIPGPDGQPIRLLTVADVREDRGPAEIHRLQQQRAAVVSADLQGRSLGSAVRDVENILKADPPPAGITAEIGGQNREMQVSFKSLWFAIGLAIFLVYVVMAAIFESLLHPFIVLFTIPFALVGVVAGLWITGTVISVIVLIGAVMLVGIVVNNAIVLIDKINQLRREGMAKEEAVIQAGHVRLRPILMTTLTTVLGLLPMALAVGEGSELRAPLAITVSSGLLLSMLLTLVVIPATYMVVPSRIRPAAEEEDLVSELPGRANSERAES
jgi:HAE1 family hydrophobic/amphiphilic exporter-1